MALITNRNDRTFEGCGVYLIKNTANGKVYVGSSTNIKVRRGNHQRELARNSHINKHLQAAWNKYGADAFEFFVIEFCEPLALSIREQVWIDYYESTRPVKGYNLQPFAGKSRLGLKHTVESRMKMSIALKGKRFSEERKAMMSRMNRGKMPSNLNQLHSPETAKKIRATLKGRKLTPEQMKTHVTPSHKGHFKQRIEPASAVMEVSP